MTISTKYARLLSATRHYIFLLPLASLFLLAACSSGGGSNPSAKTSQSNLSIADSSAFEDAGVIEFVVTLNATSDSTTSFYYRTQDGSATTSDYKAVATSDTIAAGDSTTTISIAIINDAKVEDAESFIVEILDSSSNSLLDTATGSIENDDLPSLSITDATALEGAGQIEFTVSLNALFPGNKAVSFNYETTEIAGGASAGTDYTSVVAGRATIDGGELTTSILIDISNDTLAEDAETFELVISSPQPNIQITRARATATIEDNDLPSLSITNATALEGAGQIEFIVSLNALFPGSNLVSFDYLTIDDSAIAGTDYTSKTGSATIASGELTTSITIEINDDSEIEDNETFDLEISNPHNATIDKNRARATATIENDDLPSLSITGATALENAGVLTFSARLSEAFPGNLVSFDYRTIDTGSAIAGTDYTSKTGRATIDSGELTTSILIDISDDTLVEDEETFLVEISNPYNATIDKNRARATATIENDDLPNLSITDATAFEDAGSMKFTVSLSEAFPGNIVSFDYRTINTGSAIAGADYTSVVAGSATIDIGELTTSIMINISDDTLVENDETFYLEISNPSNATIDKNRARATATIENDDLPSLSITDATAFEDAGSMKFTVSLSEAFPGNIVSFDYRTIDTGSAIAGTDYTSKTGSATIDSGKLTTSIMIEINDDSEIEDDETFYLEISSPQPNIQISRARATATIKIDELPSLSITDATAFESAGSIKLRVSLSEAFPGNLVSFDYRTIDDSAIAGTDYTSKTGSATIASGELTTSILINISNDTLVEDDEIFYLEISSPQPNIPITRARATATIKISDLSLAIADATALESAGQIEFIVSLNALFPGSKAVSFNYHTLGASSAIAGADYTSVVAGSATIDGGKTTTSILIDIIDDTRVEDEEFFYLVISENQLDIPIIKPQARGRIKIDDLPSLSIADATAAENAGVLTFRASLSEPFPRNTVVSFDYQTKRGSANNKIAWQQATADAAWSARDGHSSVVFDDKIWVLGGYDSGRKNDVWYSADGINWTRATTDAAWSARNSHSSVVFDDKIWVLGGYDGSNSKNDVWYSTDGINWTRATIAAAWTARNRHSSVVFDDKIWVLGGNDIGGNKNDVWYSADGINWDPATTDAAWSAGWGHSSVVFDGKIWVLGGGYKNDVWYSTDGINWVEASTAAAWDARENHSSVVFDDKIWVLGGDDGGDNKNDVWYSTDGINWTRATIAAAWSARYYHSSVVFGDKIWVLGGYDDSNNFNDVYFTYATGDYLKTSSTGAIPGGESSTTIDITLLDDDILELADESFDIIISNPINATIDVISGNNQATGTILADAASWSEATTDAAWSARRGHSSVVFDGKIWVLGGLDGGYKNDVWYSADGINWDTATTDAAWDARNAHSSVVFDDKIWVLGGWDGGIKNDVWYSADGINWTRATIAAAWSARYVHSSVVFDGKIWVLGGWDGGNKNDVWYSTDGINWTRATTNAAWTARWGHSSVVFDDKIWVLGGNDGGYKNDVWHSADGINWTRASIAAAWSVRQRHSSVVFNDKIWVLGGNDGGNKNDVYYSADGINWTRASIAAAWSARQQHSSVVFDGKIWVLGGNDGNNKNDVSFFGELD